jgi:hypothetical protein
MKPALKEAGTGAHGRVLKPETVAMMAQNGLGPLKIKSLPGAMPSFSHEAEFFPGMPKSWGYSFMINDEQAPTGRRAGLGRTGQSVLLDRPPQRHRRFLGQPNPALRRRGIHLD